MTTTTISRNWSEQNNQNLIKQKTGFKACVPNESRGPRGCFRNSGEKICVSLRGIKDMGKGTAAIL